jgi:predicted ATPase
MSSFKSAIRDGVTTDLLDKVAKRNYGKYLCRIRLTKLRGFDDRSIAFDFPVTALVGPNGGGKTTILGAAAIAYESVAPRQFFAKSGKLDESMLNWRAEYELVDREVNRTDTFRRTASFTSLKWSRGAEKRDVAVFGVARTVPASERKELQRCARNTFVVDNDRVEAIQAPVIEAVGHILGKDISTYTHIRVDGLGKVSLLTGATESGTAYSEFHFGAGESSIIRMVMKIESLGDNALVLIEEIENGLHPLATIRLVEYLIDLAKRKSAQAIFTTHSNDALRPLPAQAIWAAVSGELYQGKLDINALRAIAGQIDARLALFCEDPFAASWLRAILRANAKIAFDGVEVHPMLGDGTAVKVHKNHSIDPSSKFPSACYIDGNSEQPESAADRVFKLPGGMPEGYVFDQVLSRADLIGGVLTVRLLRPHSATDETIEILRKKRITNRDPHVLFSEIGAVLGLLPESTVRDAFLATWTEAYPEECARVLQPIIRLLPIVGA